MTEMHMRPSAKIYQFPRGGRASLHGQRLVKQAAAIIPSRLARPVEYGSCWYHEAAIEDAELVRWS
ncbi:DUF2735 domain-containing protein [Hyphomicrobium sp. 99]|uniref:DUF2735 domain-containing protein n=1 Tax=Hyphomicrobium sp. 99 TaxID=1163419 RepID=UPI0009E328B5|nr:DUF2735 domain-containing protein [Hyphomicrobium sp. 99]